MAGIPDPFAGFGQAAKAKFLILGSSEVLVDRVRSLNLEHVSPAHLKAPGISREARVASRPKPLATDGSAPAPHRSRSDRAEEATVLALMRRWFFARKPDAGFVLTDFPATLLQAKVFDEWLEARDEALNAVVAGNGPDESVVGHYRTLGLLLETSDLPLFGPRSATSP